MNEPERRIVTVNQAMKEAQVSRRTLYNWMEAGKIEFKRTAGGSPRIFADTLWIKDKEKK